MTLDKLAKEVAKLQKLGYGRYKVTVYKNTLDDGNGTFAACAISRVSAMRINIAGDDGGIACRKDGTKRMMNTVLLEGGIFKNSR